MSFTAQLLQQRGHTVERLYYLKSVVKGNPVYYFVLIDPPKERAFLEKIETSNTTIDLDKFAIEVIAKGYGFPSQKLKNEMQKKYRITFDDE